VTAPASPLTLAHWRRAVAEIYADVRATSDHAAAAARYRAERDRLFAEHPDTPIRPGNRRSWRGASWYPYDPKWRTVGIVERAQSVATFDIPLAADGVIHCARVARVSFTIASEPATLALYWFGGYGGGLWLPFSDATSGESTYGGGRYLYDTIKGADLGTDADRIVLDFNFAYNPSCAYDDRWVCPLSPAENALPFAVTAGEQAPEG
jgi:uncharacterized protein